MGKVRKPTPSIPKSGEAKHGSGDVKKDMGRTLDKLFGPKKGDGSNRS